MVQVAVGAEIETPMASRVETWEGGIPSRLGSMEEHRKLPQLGLGRSSS